MTSKVTFEHYDLICRFQIIQNFGVSYHIFNDISTLWSNLCLMWCIWNEKQLRPISSAIYWYIVISAVIFDFTVNILYSYPPCPYKTRLMCYWHYCYCNGLVTVMILTDLQKAFDIINYESSLQVLNFWRFHLLLSVLSNKQNCPC